MIDHDSHLPSLNPASQVHNNGDSTEGDAEFDFWAYENFNGIAGGGTEFQDQEQFEDNYGAYSPPLWKRSSSRKAARNESSPLLPHNHHYSNVSPKSRMEVIAEGRRGLMEMVRNMPESSYELSLRDIVDEENTADEARKEVKVEEKGFHFRAETQIKKQMKEKRKTDKKGPILRSGSMEKETFMIKMFLPISIGSKKKTTTGNPSKVSPRPTFERSQSDLEKDWWIKRLFVSGERRNSGRSSSSRSTSSSNSSTSRHGDCNALPGCLPFFCTKKGKSRNHRGSIF